MPDRVLEAPLHACGQGYHFSTARVAPLPATDSLLGQLPHRQPEDSSSELPSGSPIRVT